MANTIPEQNKALVLQAFDTLFNKRDTKLLRAFGRTPTSNIAPISSQAARDYSTLSEARRILSAMSPVLSWRRATM